MIVFDSVSKYFGELQVLENLTFQVPSGSVFALLGLSGSGKTTALKMVCGLIAPDRGEVRVAQLPVLDSTLKEVRSRIGYVIQDGGLFPHMTAVDNIQLVGREAGWETTRIKTRLKELADLVKLPLDQLRKYPSSLSGGQRQRVGIMRALFRDPSILLLDEPLGALDPITRSELQTELKELCIRLGKTVLLVTHDLFEAGYLADQILLLNRGQILQQGSLQELIKNPANDFVRRFVDSQRHQIDFLC